MRELVSMKQELLPMKIKIPIKSFLILISILFSAPFISCSESVKDKKAYKEGDRIPASEIISMLEKGDLDLKGVTITGDLDFTTLTALNDGYKNLRTYINHSISFEGCYFEGKVMAYKKDSTDIQHFSTFEKNLIFYQCEFLNEVSFYESEIYGQANFSESGFYKPASFEGSYFHSGNNNFSKATFKDALRFQRALFANKVTFLNSVFDGVTYFQSTSFRGDAQFGAIKFAKRADFSMLDARGMITFNYAEFGGDVSFNGSNFNNRIEMQNCKFNGNASMKRMVCMGVLKLNESSFEQTLNLSESNFTFSEPEIKGIIKGEKFSMIIDEAFFFQKCAITLQKTE